MTEEKDRMFSRKNSNPILRGEITMLLTVKGIYKDGRVEVAEKPAGVEQAKVLVTFLTSETAKSRRRMVCGQFAGEPMSSEEDFLIAEWRGE